MTEIFYVTDTDLDVAVFAELLDASGLGATRPTSDHERLGQMLRNSGLVMTARLDSPDGEAVGVARCLTDSSWCAYLSELAVSRSAQGLGVGAGLLNAVRDALGPQVSLILASMPDAVGFYEKAGMKALPDAFWFKRET